MLQNCWQTHWDANFRSIGLQCCHGVCSSVQCRRRQDRVSTLHLAFDMRGETTNHSSWFMSYTNMESMMMDSIMIKPDEHRSGGLFHNPLFQDSMTVLMVTGKNGLHIFSHFLGSKIVNLSWLNFQLQPITISLVRCSDNYCVKGHKTNSYLSKPEKWKYILWTRPSKNFRNGIWCEVQGDHNKRIKHLIPNFLLAIKIFVNVREMSKMRACLVFMLCEPLNTSIMALVVLRFAQVSMRFSCSKCQNIRLRPSRYQVHNWHDFIETWKLRLCFLYCHYI